MAALTPATMRSASDTIAVETAVLNINLFLAHGAFAP
jgi:hypothetical protein